MNNVWMEVLTARLSNYFTDALEENEYFDFMTLMRRIFADKTLMNFKLIIEQAHDLATPENLDSGLFQRKVMRSVLPRVSKALSDLPTSITVDDMRTSSYVVRENAHYTFMEAYWILIAWLAFGEDPIVPVDLIIDALVIQNREAIRRGIYKAKDASFILIGTKKGYKSPTEEIDQKKWKPSIGSLDIMQLLLQRMDQKLLAIKEHHRSSKKPEEALVSVVH
jgi:hypothetical protein